jgi:hypothetical protein
MSEVSNNKDIYDNMEEFVKLTQAENFVYNWKVYNEKVEIMTKFGNRINSENKYDISDEISENADVIARFFEAYTNLPLKDLQDYQIDTGRKFCVQLEKQK